MNILKTLMLAIHRRLDPIGYAKSIGVQVGEGCRLIDVSFSTEPYLVKLGNHVSATGTRFETHDGGVWVLRERHPEIDIIKGILVGNNVFLGYKSVVMPGVTIGDNVVIGAGAIVTRNIPSNSVAAGVPARVIKSLDEYAAKALEVGANTKQLGPAEKRAYYVK